MIQTIIDLILLLIIALVMIAFLNVKNFYIKCLKFGELITNEINKSDGLADWDEGDL